MQELTVMPSASALKTSFLEGGGELGELIRSYDWTKTPLGSPESWPQSLKTCVRIMLTSRQPIWIGWGKELIKLYNDPYKAIVGGKHPWALGQPASLVWKEIWQHIEPMLKTVMEKDEGTYVESQLLIMERNGYPEETYYTFSYTPVPGDKGGTAGMICANTDDTERIIGERQLRTLRDLGKTLAKMQTVTEVYQSALKVLENNSKDFPFAILYKVDNEERHASAIAYAGLDKDQTLFATQVDLLNPVEGTFNFCRAFSKNEIVVSENKGRRKNIPTGAWEIEASHFIHIPITTFRGNRPNAVLSAALNPYRIYDESYKQFTSMIADQIAMEVNNVMIYEEERKRAEALAEIDKAKTVFFSNISHEFRTPLTLMLGPLEELLNDPDNQLEPDEKNKIETTHRNAIRLLRLVNNLLDFSRIEAGRAKAQFQLTNIGEYTKQLAGNFRSAIEGANLKFNVVCEAIDRPVYVDRSMWEKIVFNLLSNAFKYTLEGGITVSVLPKNNNVELTVADTGVGIPENELPKMFQRFHRIENVAGRSFEGSGIGLSLVNELIKMHSGSISVSSKVGEGSQFTISIPTGKKHLPVEHIAESRVDSEFTLSDTFLEEIEILTEQISREEPVVNKDKPAILIADDNADMREYMKDLLQRNYRVITAVNGEDALEKLASDHPQLVVSDIMMPGMDGIELMKKIKNDPATINIPVILVSARAGEESRIEGYETGADDYLVKPFSAKELLARIKSQLDISKKRNEAEFYLKEFLIQAPAAIAILEGPEHIFTLANPPYQQLIGRTQEQIIGHTVKEVFNEKEGEAFYSSLDHVYATGDPYISNAVPVSFDGNGKQTKYYDTIVHPIRNNKNEITKIMVLGVDITEQVMARKKIEENEKRKDDFIRMANHELKTPVTSIKGYVQLLLDSAKNDNAPLPPLMVKSSLTSIDKQITRLTRLMSELLDLSKIETGRLELNKELFNLNELVIETVQDVLYTNSKHSINIYHDFSCNVYGDKDRIGQVLINFITNAIKYSPGSDKIEVDIKQVNKRYVSVSVKDYGIGIEKRYHEKIFERFYRAQGKEEQTFPGFGIGLFIAKEMIQRHNGTIHLESERGKGSVFTFTLPIA